MLPIGIDLHRCVSIDTLRTYMSYNIIHSRDQITCFRCGERGHVRMECMTWKVRLCTNFSAGHCTNTECSFAHSAAELRIPWNPKCIRVTKMEGKLVILGCGGDTHTYKNCPKIKK